MCCYERPRSASPERSRRCAGTVYPPRLVAEIAPARVACPNARRLRRWRDLLRLMAEMLLTSDEEAGAVSPMKYLARRTRLFLAGPDPRPPPAGTTSSPFRSAAEFRAVRTPTRRGPLAPVQEPRRRFMTLE